MATAIATAVAATTIATNTSNTTNATHISVPSVPSPAIPGSGQHEVCLQGGVEALPAECSAAGLFNFGVCSLQSNLGIGI